MAHVDGTKLNTLDATSYKAWGPSRNPPQPPTRITPVGDDSLGINNEAWETALEKDWIITKRVGDWAWDSIIGSVSRECRLEAKRIDLPSQIPDAALSISTYCGKRHIDAVGDWTACMFDDGNVFIITPYGSGYLHVNKALWTIPEIVRIADKFDRSIQMGMVGHLLKWIMTRQHQQYDVGRRSLYHEFIRLYLKIGTWAIIDNRADSGILPGKIYGHLDGVSWAHEEPFIYLYFKVGPEDHHEIFSLRVRYLGDNFQFSDIFILWPLEAGESWGKGGKAKLSGNMGTHIVQSAVMGS